MSAETHEVKKGSGDWEKEFSEENVTRWRQEAAEKRKTLFQTKQWKNRQPFMPIQSRAQEQSFSFVLSWYEESGEEIKRGRERGRLDDLIAAGLDVNDPKHQKPKFSAADDEDEDTEDGDDEA